MSSCYEPILCSNFFFSFAVEFMQALQFFQIFKQLKTLNKATHHILLCKENFLNFELFSYRQYKNFQQIHMERKTIEFYLKLIVFLFVFKFI